MAEPYRPGRFVLRSDSVVGKKDTSIEDVLRSMEESYNKNVKPFFEEIEKCRIPTLSGRHIYIIPKQNPYPVTV